MPVDDLNDLRVSVRLGYLLKHAARRLHELNEVALAPFGIDDRELGILIAIAEDGPGSQQQVAERIGIDRTSMVTRLDVLATKDLISRAPHADDRRRNVVELTDLGREVMRRAVVASDEAEGQLLRPLTGVQGDELREALALILAPGGHPASL